MTDCQGLSTLSLSLSLSASALRVYAFEIVGSTVISTFPRTALVMMQ